MKRKRRTPEQGVKHLREADQALESRVLKDVAEGKF